MSEFTYAGAGVDAALRAKAKKFDAFKKTLSRKKMLETPFNTLYELDAKRFFVLTSDGVGTKVLLAQLANKHDTVGVDGVAMVANDCVRSGARPVALVDSLDVSRSDPHLLKEFFAGVARGAREAGCAVVGGETADVAELLDGFGKNPYQANFACFGVVDKKRVVTGKRCEEGDVVIGLRSNGLHSNGFSLVRKVLFRAWGGYYDAFARVPGFEKPLVEEALAPTRIYVKSVLAAMERFDVRGAVHVTGDSFAKFKRLTRFSGVGFEFDYFDPHPIFALVQNTALKLGSVLRDEELVRTFNLGWGFALVVPEKQARKACSFLKRRGETAEVIGRATGEKKIVVRFNGSDYVL